jgi:hypothetical protein
MGFQQMNLGAAFDAIPMEQLPHLPKPTRRNAWVRYLLPNACQFGGIAIAIIGLIVQSAILIVLGVVLFAAASLLEVIWLFTLADELHRLTSPAKFSPYFCIIPGMSRWLRFEAIPDTMQVAKRRIGTPTRRRHRFAYFFMCNWAFSEDLNDILDVLEGRVSPHSGGPDVHRGPADFGRPGWY